VENCRLDLVCCIEVVPKRSLAREPSGEAIERGEGESGLLREAEESGRENPAHLEVGALAGASERGDNEKRVTC
jgi:hypothetical protein